MFRSNIYVYTLIFKEILLDISYTEDAVSEFSTYCQDRNYRNLASIRKFRQEYHLLKPVYWYTYHWFLAPTFNKAFRTLELDTIMRLGFLFVILMIVLNRYIWNNVQINIFHHLLFTVDKD